MTHWNSSPIFDSHLTVVSLAVLLLAVTALGLVVSLLRGRVPWRRCVALAGLRAGVIVVLLLSMLQLVQSTVLKQPQPRTLIVLADRSGSMKVDDTFGGKTRWQALRESLDAARDSLKDIAENVDVKIYMFDGDLQPVDFADGRFVLDEAPTGEQTAIGAAMESALRQQEGQRLAAVLLMSDGAQRARDERNIAPEQPARRMSDNNQRLVTICFGESRGKGTLRDVAVENNLQVNRTVFVKNELPVLGEIRVDGYIGQKILVQLLFENKATGEMVPVARTEVIARENGQRIPVELVHVPQEVGEHRVILRAVEQEGELDKANNEQMARVIVRKGGINVLYLEGEVRSEQRYLRRALDDSPDIKVDYRWIDHRRRQAVDLAEFFQPKKYDVYIIGDLDSAAFRPVDLDALAQRVTSDGAGLMMLGGFHGFGPGGYGATPLARLLPIRLAGSDARETTFGPPRRTDMHLEGPLRLRLPQRRLKTESITRLSDTAAKDEQLWSRLPPLDGANSFHEEGGPKPGARVLLETTSGAPLLVAHNQGGNVLAFAADSTWHWAMEGFEREHRRFWRQVVLHLANVEEDTTGSVWIKLPRTEFNPRQRVQFTTGARTALGEVASDVELAAVVELPDKTEMPVSLGRGGEGMIGSLRDTFQLGEYKIKVIGTRAGKEFGRVETGFDVKESKPETINAVANPSMLARLAEMTAPAGGKVLNPEQLPEWLQQLGEERPEEIERHVSRRLGDHWWDAGPAFLIVVALLGVEWYFRKQWGLV